MSNKAVISLTTGLEDSEKVTVAFLVAVGAAERGRPTLMFLTKEAVRLAIPGFAYAVACDGCPPLTDLILRQRRVRDLAKRRELVHQIQRHLGKQVYRAEAYSIVALAVWDPALKNYGPNLGYDYGGRLTAAWLDR